MKTSSTGKLGYSGQEPDKEDLLSSFNELDELVDIDIEDIVSLGSVSMKDSSNIDPTDWEIIAREVVNALNREYDGGADNSRD